MAVTLNELMKRFTPEQRAQVKARAAELIAEETTKSANGKWDSTAHPQAIKCK